jgi:hypothetical protein
MSDSETPDAVDVTVGQEIFDEDGNRLGTVRGFDEHGFYVTTDEGMDALSSEHAATGGAGEAELTWRCWSCGEIGDIHEIPDSCPACGAPEEDIYYGIQD